MCFFLFVEPSRCSPQAEVIQFLQPSCNLSRSCASNLCMPLAITSHSSTLSISFSGFLFFPIKSYLLDLFLHSFSPHAPTNASFGLSETLPIYLHPSSNESSHCLFCLSKFFHILFAAFSFLQSSTSIYLPLSMPNIQHHKLKHFSHSFCIKCL